MTADARRLRRLDELGIDVWQRRDRAPCQSGDPDRSDVAPSETSSSTPDEASRPSQTSVGAVPRIRLAPGRGRWLLLGQGTDRPELRAVLDDLRGLLGPEDCRFGQWSDSAESGVAAEDWPERGIDWVLDFGGPAAAHGRVVGLPSLEELARSPDARRQLWQTLRPLLETS